MDNLHIEKCYWSSLLSLMLMWGLVGCGGGEVPASEPEVANSEIVDSEPMGSPRVFFVAPEDGAMLSSDNPVVFEFGIENYELSSVPETVEQSREGFGHHHLGVNAECLPAGETIPQSAPWVHFGDGSNTIEMMLEPGQHTFTLQIGNDEHRTQEGLCETITVMLEDGI